MNTFFKLFFSNIFYLLFFYSISFSEIVKEIKISGNDRISNETILMFSELEIGENLKNSNLNKILKKLYDTNFFNNVSVSLTDNVLLINIEEAPIIQNIILKGIKSKKFKELITRNTFLKPKSSFNEIILLDEIKLIKSLFKTQGYYFTTIDVNIKQMSNNLVNIEYNIDIGNKSKISKISFIGDKIYKNKKLKSIVVSEEHKFWKFISGKKYLQEELINLDKRLLKNFYLNNGFYNAKVNSSFAKLVNDNEFELIFNIDPGKKFFFGDLSIILPNDFDIKNYEKINILFKDLKDKPYSLYSIDKILDEIDNITIEEEYKTISASLNEVIKDNKLDISFIIKESEKYFVEKINIYGNNVTRESVIRNKLDLDEGDPFSKILLKKSEKNIKSLNFFKNVQTKIIDVNEKNSKIIDIFVEEKATGEIMAGAGAGTNGGTLFFGIKENNYLGKGLSVNANATLSPESVKGKFGISNPNFKNTDSILYFNIQAIETDRLKNYGYKTSKSGFEIGSSLEYFKDLNLGLSASSFFEKIETDATASTRQKKQEGNYFDTFLNLNFNLDKRNQKFQTTDGYFSNYKINLPLISENYSLTNTYNFKKFSELYKNNVSSFSILLSGANSLSGEDIKLSERLFIPPSKLRGFESGKIGPKDGNDFIGGNYLAAINLQSNLPNIFQNSQNLDAVIFLDIGNVWGVDYDSSIDDLSKIRSSIGIGVDWMTVIGPFTFSLTEAIAKQNSDITESFRFNLGTSF